ncbi:hypothetical protein [Falsigemmobacter faecalis]|uniref:Uncharacterized protein n=1 Tax=Falsigemmobacter faecalis TaxID=2488730 RepID=A0A3P3DD61_9RHOB|nr:hypothetical protein [Falsigemmobacter faecalis]RRH71382.1 hypothetical protein EG244_16330 [Falsigemmobacter faecalis]
MLTPAAPLRLPCATEASYLARQILRRPDATRSELKLAICTLSNSTDWRDIDLARATREQLRASDRIGIAEEVRRQAEVSPLLRVSPKSIDTASPHVSDMTRAITYAAAAMMAALLVVIGWSAAAETITNTKQQAAVWRSQH